MQHLLLLHGAIGAKDQLEALERSLRENYIVHRLNFNGHGDAPYRSFSINNFADDVLEYLNVNNIDSVNIFGYSMGGYVGMYLAKYHPEKIKFVITLATKFNWDETIAAKEIKMLAADVIENKIPAFAQALTKRHRAQDWKLVLEKTAVMLTQMGNKNPLQLEDHSSISTPVLLMLGDRDKMVTLEETVAVYKNLPNAQLMVLPGTGHPIEGVDMERLGSEILKFVGA